MNGLKRISLKIVITLCGLINKMSYVQEYFKMLHLFQENKITEEEWKRYCMLTLEKLMRNNSDVLARLKR